MKDKVVVITGANSGIGKVTATALAKMGSKIVMVCRNLERAKVAQNEIIQQSNNENIDLMLCDLSLQGSILNFSEKFKQKYDHIDVLINNAGMYLPERQETEEGIEYTIALNHMGYFLTTELLLDCLKESPKARIINVSSDGHRIGKINFDDFQYTHKYNGLKVYCDSKLMNIYFTTELARRLKGTNITTNCLHPGAVATNFAQQESSLFGWAFKLVKPFLISSESGAKTSIYLASSSEVEDSSGQYFVRCKKRKASRLARNQEIAKRLWEKSEELKIL